MFSHRRQPVKPKEECKCANPFSWRRDPARWLLHEIDCHPRLGWFWVALLVLNTILNVLDLTGFGK